jgi:uncharacterized protein YvpB
MKKVIFLMLFFTFSIPLMKTFADENLKQSETLKFLDNDPYISKTEPLRQYATLSKSNYKIWKNFKWEATTLTSTILQHQTFQTNLLVTRKSGEKFILLKRESGEFLGFINQRAVKLTQDPQGTFRKVERTLSIKSCGYSIYSNFKWKKSIPAMKLKGQTIFVRGCYTHLNGNLYYSIYSLKGKWLGYLNQRATSENLSQLIPVGYYSQLKIGASYGCAATSLFTALRAKGYAKQTSLYSFVKNLPLSKTNVDNGQIGGVFGNPPFKKVISPIGLNKYAKKFTKSSKVFSKANLKDVQIELLKGNPILFWGVWKLNYGLSLSHANHVLILLGYKRIGENDFYYIQDPGAYSSLDPIARRWINGNWFENYYQIKRKKLLLIY